ncbi:2-oxoglutarate (2OG) and Fe(II)-dependent oxygenase superfamily protein [Striga hermonthica]|uniref:2-oxoglutarate (2OG) and Fe(II)-dependent oxygenase superfamily protein n=1 Tax=Striga hermonthica TaxID=68872 RepID=A0A9N7MT96_STRHE|nr:2-oxoglutarate (2OG) and Fe(II)-dependent oxygenase superfamily protein [Striga hermonthica]
MEVSGSQIRVQSLVEDGRKPVVPPQYVQPVETRPRHTPEANKNYIEAPPVIDICSLDSVRELGKACKQWGAFHVVNHGIPAELLDEMRRLGRLFFEDCTMDQKLRFACNPNSPASEGYGSRMLVESNDTVLDWRDYFDHHSLPFSRRDPSKWPSFSSNYREVVAEYSDRMSVLADKLLRMTSESLGLPSSCIKEAVGEFYQNITVSYYPPCPQPELTLGLQSHSDFGAITLLIQDDVGGLQVSKDGEWITVNPLSDAIFVILADQTEIITNGQYKSAIHRAITNAKKARLSVATFHDPAKTKTISPALEPPIYRPVIYGDYVSSWYSKGPEGKRNIDSLLL